MRRVPVLGLAVAAVVLTACGSETAPPAAGDSDGSTATSDALVIVDPEDELVGHGILMQSDPDGPVELCVGGVAESLPPQCGGPTLEGDFSWDEVKSETVSGVTWTNDHYYAVGHFSPTGGDDGTFTLTQPVSAEPPEGFTPPEREEIDFPQLCDDPTADVADTDQAASTGGPEAFAEENALHELTQGMEGYVTSWVSDGGAVTNVVVNSDADEARAQIREVFSGPLCVEQRDLPAEQGVRAAQEAVGAEFRELGMLSSGGGGPTGVLEVQVLLADRSTVDRIHELVAPWLTPEQVVVQSALLPLNG